MVVVINTDKVTNPLVVQSASTISPRCLELIAEFQRFGSKTFEGLVALGKTVVAAKVELPTKEYKYFCEEIGLKPDSPTVRKFECIGRNAGTLEALGDRMPNRWTTLYLIASMTPEQLQMLASHSEFGPNITAQKVRQIALPKRPQQVPQNLSFKPEHVDSAWISFAGVENQQQLFEEVHELQKRFLFSCTWILTNGIEIYQSARNVVFTADE